MLSTLHYTNYITLHYTTLYYTTLHYTNYNNNYNYNYITLHYTTLITLGSGIVLGIILSGSGIFWDPFFLHVFLASCRILELEAAISTALQHVGVETSHFP